MNNKFKGTIIKIISNFIYVKYSDNKVYECKMKGLFRHKNIKPLVGDLVSFELDENNIGLINEVFERKNQLKRPPISNIDQVIIISACKEPNFNSMLLNKYLFIVEYLSIKPVLIFTKNDLLQEKDKQILEQIHWYKKMNYLFFDINNDNLSNNKLNSIKKILSNNISVFTGQTGSGKSTTINNILGKNIQKTDAISKALGRGKHTTRNSEIFFTDNNIQIIDTPGFSSFDINDIDINILAQKISPFKNYWYKCKFKNCIHINEPNCAIKKLISEEIIPNFFYEDYKKIVLEFQNTKRK